MDRSEKIIPGASMRELLAAIALEATYQHMLDIGAPWTRKKMFLVGQRIVIFRMLSQP